MAAGIGLAGCVGSPDRQASPTTERERTDTPTSTERRTETASATATAEPTEPTTETPTERATATVTPTGTGTDATDRDVIVAPNAALSFAPESFSVVAGDTVQWTWEAGGHNVRPSSTPADADWPGTPGGDGETFGAGYTYAYTFDVPGTYEYYCAPHRSLGMTGSFTVE